jgi:hypothetical protein
MTKNPFDEDVSIRTVGALSGVLDAAMSRDGLASPDVGREALPENAIEPRESP